MVDLPEPLGPINPNISFSLILKEISFKIFTLFIVSPKLTTSIVGLFLCPFARFS